MIVAHDPNLLIGAEGGLPWKYSEDLKFFKRVTMGCPIIMGRRVFEEIGEKPLPGRRNIVLSRTKEYSNVDSYKEVEKALESLRSENTTKCFIIGGVSLYEQFLPLVDEFFVTKVKKVFEGDTWFPPYQHLIDSGHFSKASLLEEYDELEMWLYEKGTELQE
jgi:dihydrofolate reductase